MNEVKCYLEFSSDDLECLAARGLSIEDVLNQAEIKNRIAYDILPSVGNNPTKNIVPVLVISLGAVAVLSFAIGKILNIINRRPRFVHIYEDEVIRNADGNVLLDEEGNPQYKLIEKYDLLEPMPEDYKDGFELSVKNGCFIIKYFTEKRSAISKEDMK